MAEGDDLDEAWDLLVGQPHAVRELRAAVADPVHAYLFVGPRGTGKRAAARVFAGSLVAAGSTDPRRDAHLALAEHHPDIVVFEPEGRTLRATEARFLVLEASRSPVEGDRKVIVCTRFHAAEPEAAASLLKTIEEPPPTAVFVLLADEILPEHVTIASRCVTIEFVPLADDEVVAVLVAAGAAPEVAATVAEAAAGDLDRARLLVSDPDFLARRDTWWAVPDRLDGTGATVTRLVDELRERIDAAQAPLVARQRDEVTAHEEAAAAVGAATAGARKELEDRHKREARRLRDDELRFGLAVLARRYRERAVAGDRAAVAAVARLREANEALVRNPNEALLLQSVLLDLPRW